MTKNLNNDVLEILVDEKELKSIHKRLGKQISKDYKNIGNTLVVVGILKGCIPFMSDLMKKVTIHVEMYYMQTRSYFGGTCSTGKLEVLKDIDLEVDFKNRDVLIVEDIVDTARTIKKIKEILLEKGAKSVKVCTLLDKPSGRVTEFVPEYIGKEIPGKFVIGYGLDYEERYRNLPYVGVLKPEVYTK